MKANRSKRRAPVTDIVRSDTTQADTGYVRDLNEVLYLELYHEQPIRRPRRSTGGRPLIDVVNPQPKAFFAYLRMPAQTAKSTAPKKKQSSKRVSRRKKGTV